LHILADLPYAHPVTTRSIIANRGKPGPLETSSDGIVPCSSSHLPTADSGKTVPSGHEPMNHPETVEEILRILKLR
jgi:hypothetical protein